jgi:hypothetical protein
MFPETLGTTYPTTQCHVPVDLNPQKHCSENLKYRGTHLSHCSYRTNQTKMNENGHLTPYMYLGWILPAKQRAVVNSFYQAVQGSRGLHLTNNQNEG